MEIDMIVYTFLKEYSASGMKYEQEIDKKRIGETS